MIPPNRLVISEIMSGQQTYEKPFFVNNDSFPILVNALCWRKRVTKKQGSSFLGRVARTIFPSSLSPVMTLDGSGNGSGNLISSFLTEPNPSITPGGLRLTDGTNNYTDPAGDGVIVGVPGGSGTINYATGAITITGGAAGQKVTGAFNYFPGLPVLGIEEFESDKSANTQIDFPTNVFLDQKYSYLFNGTSFYDASFYKQSQNPVTWSGGNYQQFYSSNYYRALFVTNNNPGMQFKVITGMPLVGNVSQFTVSNHGLNNSDSVFINQVGGVTNVNGVSGVVTVIDPNTFSLPTPGGAGAFSSNGIAQYMTQMVNGNGDGIRWFDGDSVTSGGALGWVNFAPPLDNNMDSTTTYLMGARIILPFGNRLLAIGTFEATSGNVSSPTYYGNRIRYCEVSSTPFYASPVPATNPTNGFNANAWISNIQGFGGFIDLDTTQRIISAAIIQGSLILGLEKEQRKMTNTGIEVDPFALQVINPEFGSASTFGVIPMDKGIISAGEYGFLETSSYDSKRIDQKIIDQIFQVNQSNNGYERICAARDFVNEVIYFTYYSDTANPSNTYPDTTVVVNYREGSFATWYETFTTYGIYKNSTIQAWQTYFTPWENWTTNWEDLGADRFSKPFVAGGTPTGFVMLKWDEDSFNGPSIYIQAIASNGDGTYTLTVPNHNLYEGQYIGFWPNVPSNSVISPSFNAVVNSVSSVNVVIVSFSGSVTPGSIIPGIWLISIIDQPDVWTKQFQFAWSNNKKTRIGAQKYFLDTTTFGEFTVNIYGSQSTVSLDDPINSSIISSNIVRTRPDDSVGLYDNAITQTQIWHRLPSSAIGDTVQLQYTFSPAQMLDVDISTAPWVLYSTILDLYPSRILA